MDEKRLHARVRAHWRVALQEGKHPPTFGETLDVSPGGATVLSEHTIVGTREVTVFLKIPPRKEGQEAIVIEISAKVLYTAFSAKHGRWRSGVQFTGFKGKDQELLERELRHRA